MTTRALRWTTALILPVVAAVLLAGSSGAVAQKKSAESEAAAQKPAESKAAPASNYLRLVRAEDEKTPAAMQTSIVRFVPADGTRSGLSVDLIAAVHVGEKTYYKTLNEKFEQYDVLLYELVAPKGTRIPKGGAGGSGHPVGAMQQGMKDMLNLEFQLEQIDYTKKNFVHADMSPEEFAKSMKDRDESFMAMFFRMMGQAMAKQSEEGGKGSDLDLILALFSRDRAHRLKVVMAEQFEDLGGTMTALDGPEGSTIITERNKVALDVLKKQIADGKTKIGIFYGAGHLPDMEKRLVEEFQLKATDPQWIDAWNLRKTDMQRRDGNRRKDLPKK